MCSLDSLAVKLSNADPADWALSRNEGGGLKMLPTVPTLSSMVRLSRRYLKHVYEIFQAIFEKNFLAEKPSNNRKNAPRLRITDNLAKTIRI